MDELTMGKPVRELSNRPIEVITQEIQFYKGQATMAIIEIGRRLEEVKLRVPHGQWGEWLKNDKITCIINLILLIKFFSLKSLIKEAETLVVSLMATFTISETIFLLDSSSLDNFIFVI